MKKLKTIIVLFFVLVITSCHFFKPEDNINMKHLTTKPEILDIVGVWEIDKFSSDFIEKYYDISNRKVELELMENGIFKIKNFPDFEIGGFGKPINNKLLEITGKWELIKMNFKDYWSLNMRFDKEQPKPYNLGVTTFYDLYKKKIVV